MSEEFKLIRRYFSAERGLKNYGYGVNAIDNGFFIHNKKGTMVADCKTVDGLMAFLQAVELFEAEKNKI